MSGIMRIQRARGESHLGLMRFRVEVVEELVEAAGYSVARPLGLCGNGLSRLI